MHELERHLQDGQHLNAAQVREAAAFLLDPSPDATRKAALLRASRARAKRPGEIAAFVNEFLQHAITPPLDLRSLSGPVLDVVGTGGDKLNLFNVSTTSMFILAAGGVCIVKHGNRGITGKSGGADVLEALGAKIDLEPARSRPLRARSRRRLCLRAEVSSHLQGRGGSAQAPRRRRTAQHFQSPRPAAEPGAPGLPADRRVR